MSNTQQVCASVPVAGPARLPPDVDTTQDTESRLQREFQLHARLPRGEPTPSHAQSARRQSIGGVTVIITGVLPSTDRTGCLSPG